MYFLNGDRIYIKPQKACGSLDEQLKNCLMQLRQINSGKQIFKLNFFIDSASDLAYNGIKSEIAKKVKTLFPNEILLNLIAQPPLTCKIIVEAFFFDPELWKSEPLMVNNNAAIYFKREDSEVLIGNVQSNEKRGCRKEAESTFLSLGEFLSKVNFPINSIVRQWNYLEDIVGFEGQLQKYQEFNNVRSAFYADHFKIDGYPAATGIGMNRGGIIVEFVAIKSDKMIRASIDNPGQVAAHNYSNNVLIGEDCVLKTTPKFERAVYLELFNRKQVFISGTASILGEKTVGVGDPAKQTEITIDNIKRLYSFEVLEKFSKQNLQPKYGHARVYVKNRKDFGVIKQTFKKHFGNLPVVYIIADICRPDLLVEIEGKVILV